MKHILKIILYYKEADLFLDRPLFFVTRLTSLFNAFDIVLRGHMRYTIYR